MAISLKNRMVGAWIASGTLAVTSLTGGAAPRSMLEGVEWADWSPDGKELAVARQVGPYDKLEYPIGNVVDQTSGWFSHVRIAPSGRMIAYIEHSSRAGDPGSIALLDLDSKSGRKVLSTGWGSAYGLAWSPDGKEIWFTATTAQSGRALHGVNLAGQVRLMDSVPGNPILQDVAPSGRALLTLDSLRTGLIALAPGSKTPRDLSWLDFTALRDMSGDGNTLLFDEAGEAAGEFGAIYLRKADGSPPVRLSTGLSTSLSPDGQWVVGYEPNSAKGWDLALLPAGPGEPRIINKTQSYAQWALLAPDGKNIIISDNEPGHGTRLYIQSTKGGPAKAITEEGVSLIPYAHSISPDGKQVIAIAADQTFGSYSAETGQRRAISGLAPGQVPIGWAGDGRSLYVYQPGEIPARISRLDLDTGRSTFVEELVPPDPAGVTFIRPPHFSGDGKAYAYSYTRILSDLYLAEGLK
jgi:dipeptidyl aminopeptidase/acylaminoacyl peptidase